MADNKLEVQPNAGGYRKCPDCNLPFRYQELFTQHRVLGCKSIKVDGPTWSEMKIDGETETDLDSAERKRLPDADPQGETLGQES